ncbi:MAG TPA: efflux RND transporter permease subunit [Vicinamibacterales bacterium]|nr:efflux RND transporter permease subunit [Vicinamibacterales bacterium]
MSIPRFAIQRPVMMSMISAIVILLGAISLTRLPVDLLPDIAQPTINVRVNYTGVGPLEMEELVTRPLEQQLSAVSGLRQMNSTSSEGNSQIQLNFEWGHDLNEAMDDIRTRIDRVRGRLPEDADPPVIQKFDPNQQPILRLAVESLDGSLDRVQLRELAEQTLSPRLERVYGVAAVTVDGGLRRQVHVDLSREKITALDLSVDRVVNVLRTENQNIPIGEIYRGDRSFLIRSQGQFENLEQIENLVVLTKAGVPVYMKDIADISDSTEDVRSVLRINGRPGVRLQVTKQSGTNTVEIARDVRAEVERINREVPGVSLTMLQDNAKFIERAIAAVQEHVMIGSILVVLIIFLFLRSPRSTLIVCTAIPISVVGTFALLYFTGMTLNTMTFGGLALGVGMIVDAAIVVLENSYRHMEHHGKDRMTASIDGSEEVWSAILASILTHIAVFVPLLFLTGVSSVMFRQLSFVVVFSLAMSLFVAVTLVPVLCSRLLKLPPPAEERKGIVGRVSVLSERLLENMDEGYRRLLHKALNHRAAVVGIAAASVVAAALIFPTLPTEFTTQTDEGQVNVNVELPQGTRIEITDPVLRRIEDSLAKLVPEATTIIVQAGAGGGNFQGGGGGGGAVSRGNINVMLTPKDERTRSSEQIAQDLRRQLSGIPGVVVRANPAGGNQDLNRLLSGGGNNGGGRLSIEIRGEDLNESKQLAQAVKDVLDATPGVADSRLGRDEGRPELAVRVDRAKAALLGISATNLANTIRTNIAGTQAALFRQAGKEYPIVVRLREEERQDVNDVDNVLISTAGGVVMPARNLMRVDDAVGPTQIQRKNQQRINFVSAEPEVTLSEAVQAVQDRLPQVMGQVSRDFSVGFGAEVEQQAEAFSQLRMVLILALVLVYAVMASQYESFRDPFIIMFSVPTAAIGVVLALKLTGTAFNMQAYIGIIMLAGIVVSNGILLVDYTNVLRHRDGLPIREAVEVAGRTRLRPILMTSIATALGLVPMSLGIGEGSELQVPLARVVIGGLTTSLLITLVLVPTVYTIFEEGLSGLFKWGKTEAAAGVSGDA